MQATTPIYRAPIQRYVRVDDRKPLNEYQLATIARSIRLLMGGPARGEA